MPLSVACQHPRFPRDPSDPPDPLGPHLEAAGSHEVQFFAEDSDLIRQLTSHLHAGIILQAGGLAVMAPERHPLLLAAIAQDPVLAAALAEGRLVVEEATALLARFMRDGVPDPALFHQHVGGCVAGLIARHGSLRAYGEMVDVLWARGQCEATIRLEELWARLIQDRPVRLLCGYRLSSFATADAIDGFQRICQAHGEVHVALPTVSADRQAATALPQLAQASAAERHQRRLARLDLQTSLEVTRRLLDSTQDCIIVLDGTGRLLSMNDGAARGFQAAGSSLLAGSDYRSLWQGDDRAAADHALALARGGGSGRFQGFSPTLAGTPRWWDVVVSPVRATEAQVDRLLVIARDITDLRLAMDALAASQAAAAGHAQELARANAELARSNGELEQFAYVAAHDLKEPIRMIVSYLQVIDWRSGPDVPADVTAHLALVRTSALRLHSMVQSLLDYSRIGRFAAPQSRLEMAAVLQAALEHLATRISETASRIEVGILPMVDGRADDLTRLWQNLVANAITFHGDEPPRVRISCIASATEWEFCVADNGIGIAQEDGGKLFGLFQRLHPPERFPGTGIGLASCRKIVEHHGGRIWFDSVVGLGSRFFFTLPR